MTGLTKGGRAKEGRGGEGRREIDWAARVRAGQAYAVRQGATVTVYRRPDRRSMRLAELPVSALPDLRDGEWTGGARTGAGYRDAGGVSVVMADTAAKTRRTALDIVLDTARHEAERKRWRQAAARMQADAEAALRGPRMTMSWSPVPGMRGRGAGTGSRPPVTGWQVRGQRNLAAIEAALGKPLALAVSRLVVEGWSLARIVAAQAETREAALHWLAGGLERAAQVYDRGPGWDG